MDATHSGLALVTGGATGIGAACARELRALGFRVAVHFRSSEAAAHELCRELGDALPIRADLSEKEGVDAVYDALKAEATPLAVLVNNAGMTVDGPLFSAKLDDFDAVASLNLRGTWYLTKRLVRLMMRRRQGRVINVSSVVGSTGNAFQTVYSLTKAGLEGFTRSLARELAEYGILVNAVAPGFIDTAMTRRLDASLVARVLEQIPLARMGQPEEVAEVVGFLATRASYCTGAVIHVNGGMYGG